MKPPKWSTAQWREANATLEARSGGKCEACGVAFKTGDRTARHHRQRRAVGGDRLSNILLIHDACHLQIHAHPESSRESGHIVSVYVDDPSSIPVSYQRRTRVLLSDLGSLSEAPERSQSAAAPDLGASL